MISSKVVVLGKLRARSFASSPKIPKKVLVTGSNGQIGLELLPALHKRYGEANVIASDIRSAPGAGYFAEGGAKFVYLDVLDASALNKLIVEEGITAVIHNVAILSAVGEAQPALALKVNNIGTENVFEACIRHKLQCFVPSTIAVFGPTSPKDNTPDDCILRPTTMYGLTKIHTELLGEYYYRKFGLDFRSLRYPGVISSVGVPGGGTTDYAVDIYHKALIKNRFSCFLKEDSALPMIYMPDLLQGTISLMEADPSRLRRRVYNMGSLSFTPKQLAESIQKHWNKDFHISYKPDSRQAIANSWPRSIDSSNATADWGWSPKYDLDAMTIDMVTVLKKRYNR